MQHLTLTVFLLMACYCLDLSSGNPLLPRYDEPNSANNYQPLRIGSFNIQVFGTKKMSKTAVKDVLIKIILRYDIMLVQEIRSTKDKAIMELLNAVNKASSPKNIYSLVLSKRLGRSASKEQYAFIYRKDKVDVMDSYVFDDNLNDKDVFQREPFIVKFKAPNTYLTEFVLVAIHTQPTAAPKEIDHLVDVYDDIVKRLSTKNVLIMGDFNAGCSYVTKSKWKRIRLATDHRFYWLFNDNEDSTVAKSDCPYDRMVIGGEQMKKAIVPNSEKVFNFAEALGLTHKLARLVSDHWVIEAQLKDQSYIEEEQFYKTSHGLTVLNEQQINKVPKAAMARMKSIESPPLEDFINILSITYTKQGKLFEISLTKKVNSLEEAREAVQQLHQEHPELVSAGQVIISVRKLNVLLDELKKSCQVEKEDEHEFKYQMIPDGSCSHKFKLSSATLVCNFEERSCQLEFLIED